MFVGSSGYEREARKRYTFLTKQLIQKGIPYVAKCTRIMSMPSEL